MTLLRRCISSIKSMSPLSRLVRSPARSPPFSITGPDVALIVAPIAFAMMNASVVFPSPGGPEKSICSSGSPLSRAAWIKMPSRSFIFSWPTKSLNSAGRSLRSN